MRSKLVCSKNCSKKLETHEVVSIQEKVMNMKCNVIVDAWLGKIAVPVCALGIFLFTLTIPAIKLYSVQVFV